MFFLQIINLLSRAPGFITIIQASISTKKERISSDHRAMPNTKVVFAPLNFSACNFKLSCSAHSQYTSSFLISLFVNYILYYVFCTFFYFSGSHPVCTEIIFSDDFWKKGNKVFECRL